MAAVKAPDVPSLPRSLVEDGRFPMLRLKADHPAGAAHQQVLPDGASVVVPVLATVLDRRQFA